MSCIVPVLIGFVNETTPVLGDITFYEIYILIQGIKNPKHNCFGFYEDFTKVN
jgi:hypothetical protein